MRGSSEKDIHYYHYIDYNCAGYIDCVMEDRCNLRQCSGTSGKSKEILGKDEVSVLLELEYPKLGDDLQVAYTMYGKPKYESINQKDFVLQKEENKEIYIKHNEENQIESFDFL